VPTNGVWERRIRRTEELRRQWPFAQETLLFFRAVTSFQQELYHRSKKSASGDDRRLDTVFLTSFFPPLFELVARRGPPGLSSLAQRLADRPESEWERVLRSYWNREARRSDGSMRFFPRVILQPYTMLRADRWREEVGALGEGGGTCPFCGHAPGVGVTRGEARSFVCSLCSTEWETRLSCPGCGEKKLSRHSATAIPWVWIEGCASCRRYLKVVDIGAQPEAEPVVDEIGSIALDGIARERNFTKIETNVLGS
jgi:formate dehydrogenase maturation protein FdhE